MQKEEDKIDTVDVAKEARQKIYESFGLSSELLWRIKREGPKELEDIIVDTMKQQNDLLKRLHIYIKKHETTSV